MPYFNAWYRHKYRQYIRAVLQGCYYFIQIDNNNNARLKFQVEHVWTLLHKNRLSREKTPDRVNLLQEMKSQKGKKGLMSFVFRSKRSLGNIEKEHEDNDLDQANLKGST